MKRIALLAAFACSLIACSEAPTPETPFQWQSDGERPQAGMLLRTDALGRWVVGAIVPGSPAADAGLKEGDVVVSYAGVVLDSTREDLSASSQEAKCIQTTVDGTASMAEFPGFETLREKLTLVAAGEAVPIEVERGKEVVGLTITFQYLSALGIKRVDLPCCYICLGGCHCVEEGSTSCFYACSGQNDGCGRT